MMEQLSDNPVEQGGISAAAPAISAGRALREARERLGLSIADVSAQTRLAPRQIEALEEDDFQHLPEMPFVRGFIRNYAGVLRLDAQTLLASLPQQGSNALHALPESIEVPFPDARLPQRQNLIWLGAALLLAVLVVVVAVWNYTAPVSRPEAAKVETPVALPAEMKIIAASAVPEAPVAEPASAVPVSRTVATQPAQQAKPAQQTKPEAQAAAQTGSPVLHLVFGSESWAEIKDKDGKVLASRINARGSELHLDGAAPFSLTIARAESVRLYYRGKPVDLKPHINASSEVARLTLE